MFCSIVNSKRTKYCTQSPINCQRKSESQDSQLINHQRINSSLSCQNKGTSLKIRMLLSFYVICSCLPFLAHGLVLKPERQEVSLWSGTSFVLTCNRGNNEKTGILKWIGPDMKEITDDQLAKTHVERSMDSLRLIFREPKKKDTGKYSCQLVNADESPTQVHMMLRVYKSLSFQGTKDTVIAVNGDRQFTVSCFVKFDTDAIDSQVDWLFNNNPVNLSDPKNGKYAVQVATPGYRSVLTIRNVTKADEGRYTCRALTITSFDSQMDEFFINIRVQFAPRFPPNSPKTIWVANNTTADPQQKSINVNITCIVNADPPASLSWLTESGKPVASVLRGGQLLNITHGENMSVLTIKYTLIKDSPSWKNDKASSAVDGNINTFKCVAKNDVGINSTIYDIKIGSLPISPEIASYSYEKGLLTLQLNETTAEPPVDIYRVNIDSRFVQEFNASTDSNNGTYAIPIDIPTGQYTLKVYAHNPIGWSHPQNMEIPISVSGSGRISSSLLTVLFVLLVNQKFKYFRVI